MFTFLSKELYNKTHLFFSHSYSIVLGFGSGRPLKGMRLELVCSSFVSSSKFQLTRILTREVRQQVGLIRSFIFDPIRRCMLLFFSGYEYLRGYSPILGALFSFYLVDQILSIKGNSKHSWYRVNIFWKKNQCY